MIIGGEGIFHSNLSDDGEKNKDLRVVEVSDFCTKDTIELHLSDTNKNLSLHSVLHVATTNHGMQNFVDRSFGIILKSTHRSSRLILLVHLT